MSRHACGIANYYYGSFTVAKEFAVPNGIMDCIALVQAIGAFTGQAQAQGETNARSAVAGDCPEKCKFKHSFIGVELADPKCTAEEKIVGRRRITVWRYEMVVNWIAEVICNGHGPSTETDTSASYAQILEWMPEDKRIQAIADQRHLYGMDR